MEQEWQLEVHGVRGSFPRSDPDEYGGNTSCLSLRAGEAVIALDAGSGLSTRGRALAGDPTGHRVHILITHFHMDHILGLFSFAPFFDPGWEVCLYGLPGLRRAIESLICPPYWPVTVPDFDALVTYTEVVPGNHYDLDGVRMTAYPGCHPGDALYYRLDGAGKSLVYALDCEPDAGFLPGLTAFARDCGLLIWDANFAPGTLRPGWGHSTWAQGLEAARLAGARRVMMTHYNHSYDSAFLRKQEDLARMQNPDCIFAREGMVEKL